MRQDFFNKAFDGYEVPKKIKDISTEICIRFAITGVCDPMYISNVIATENNIGDGEGNFTGDIIINVTETAERLQGAYGCNILKSEIREIEYCLENGKFLRGKAIDGLCAFKLRIEQELTTCDEWRVDYLNRVLDNIRLSLNYFQ
jgi:hypothetical protein